MVSLRWYTSLLGKSSSVPSLVETLKEQSVSWAVLAASRVMMITLPELQINNYGVAEFVQSHTKRWVILWSLGDIRLPDVRLDHLSSHATFADEVWLAPVPDFEKSIRWPYAPPKQPGAIVLKNNRRRYLRLHSSRIGPPSSRPMDASGASGCKPTHDNHRLSHCKLLVSCGSPEGHHVFK